MVAVLGMWPSCPLAFAHRRSSPAGLVGCCPAGGRYPEVAGPPAHLGCSRLLAGDSLEFPDPLQPALPCSTGARVLSQAEGMLPLGCPGPRLPFNDWTECPGSHTLLFWGRYPVTIRSIEVGAQPSFHWFGLTNDWANHISWGRRLLHRIPPNHSFALNDRNDQQSLRQPRCITGILKPMAELCNVHVLGRPSPQMDILLGTEPVLHDHHDYQLCILGLKATYSRNKEAVMFTWQNMLYFCGQCFFILYTVQLPDAF